MFGFQQVLFNQLSFIMIESVQKFAKTVWACSADLFMGFMSKQTLECVLCSKLINVVKIAAGHVQ